MQRIEDLPLAFVHSILNFMTISFDTHLAKFRIGVTARTSKTAVTRAAKKA